MFSSEYKASYPKLNSHKPKFNTCTGNSVGSGVVKQKEKAGGIQKK